MSLHPDASVDRNRDVVLTLCRQCDPARFDAQVAALNKACVAAGLDVAVRGQDCLNCCDMPQALAIQGRDRAVCVFHGVDATKDLDDVVNTLTAYLKADRGWIEDAMSCGRLRTCLRARIAAF